jgi:predicted DNA-binding transcriptional regulator YafY
MHDTAARLLRRLSLLQTRREWSGYELAHRLEISPRTVRRDVDHLRELGYPLNATRGSAGYRLGGAQRSRLYCWTMTKRLPLRSDCAQPPVE